MSPRNALLLAITATLAACAGKPHAPGRAGESVPGTEAARVPRFARRSFEPFSRDEVIAIALREWRLFDRPVDDDPPNTRPPLPASLKPERMPGLWERVGEYWWIGINADEYESDWTGKHDQTGWEFPASQDAQYAWSATFISYVMRIAGAGPRFPYSFTHSDYIDIAKEQALGGSTGYAITAERLNTYAPQPGDLICLGRGLAGQLTYDDLPAGHFPAHCDIVVRAQPGLLDVVGGNVDDAVTMKHVPVTADGKLATPDGTVLDTRYPWLAVIRVLYDAPPVS